MRIKRQRHESMSITGHRWHKLPFGTNEKDPGCKALVEITTEILARKFDEGITHVINGMALGYDTLVAEAVIRLRQRSILISLWKPLCSALANPNCGLKNRRKDLTIFCNTVYNRRRLQVRHT